MNPSVRTSAIARADHLLNPEALAIECEDSEAKDLIESQGLQALQGGSDRALRPQRLEDYVGQKDFCTQLKVYITAALQRSEPLDHTLLSGPPGLGKTTLAQIIAHEMQGKFHVTSGPVLEKPGDLASLLTTLNAGDVLFIDEIHRLSSQVEEILYPAMEDCRLDILVGDDSTRAVSIPIAPFTLVAATTRAGSISGPLRDRFGIQGRLIYYTPDELSQIIQTNALKLSCSVHPQAAQELAQRARGTARIANRLLRRIRDFAQVYAPEREVTLDLVRQALDAQGVAEQGLDRLDARYLYALHFQFTGRPVGVETLSAALSEARTTLEDSVEPFLLQRGFIARTPRGRQITEQGAHWIGQWVSQNPDISPDTLN